MEGYVDTLYDFSSDVMNENWGEQKAFDKLMNLDVTMVCDALMEQDVFAGIGNIIKNEFLMALLCL